MKHAFEITLIEDDLVEGFRLNARFERVRPVILAIVLLGALLAMIFMISPQARWSAQHRPLTLLLEGAAGILLLLVVALFASLGSIWRRGARRQLAQRRDLSEPIRYEVTAESLRHTSCFSDSTYPWPALRAWRESDKLMLIYISDLLFYPIPKSRVAPEAIDFIRAALTHAGVAKR